MVAGSAMGLLWDGYGIAIGDAPLALTEVGSNHVVTTAPLRGNHDATTQRYRFTHRVVREANHSAIPRQSRGNHGTTTTQYHFITVSRARLIT